MDIGSSNRKVVLVRGGKNKAYEQAIFILKAGVLDQANGNLSEYNIDFVKEAERIINGEEFLSADYSHLNQIAEASKRHAKKPKAKSKFDIFLNFSLVITGLAVLILLWLNFM